MRILFLSIRGEGLGVGWRMATESDTVSVFSTMDIGRSGEGMLNKIPSWRPELSKSDLVVCDRPWFHDHEDVIKSQVKAVLGCSKFGFMLMGRKKDAFLEGCGLAKCSNIEQTVAVHAWFNGRNWVRPFYLSSVEHYLMPGDLGPAVDSMGCALVRLKEDPPSSDTIGKNLRRLGVKDFVTLIYAWEDGELKISGVYCGMAYDIVEAIAEGLYGNLSDLLFKIAMGITDELDVSDDYLLSVRVTKPPWPYIYPSDGSEGLEIKGINDNNLKHLFLCDVRKDNGQYFTGDGNSIVMKAAARGRTLKEASRRVYRTLGNIELDGKQYRLDIGKKAKDEFALWDSRGLIND